MTNKRFNKLDRNIATQVIRSEEDLVKEVGVDSRESLDRITRAFTSGTVSIEFEKGGVLVQSLDSDPVIRHRLVYPFRLRVFYVAINWVETTADLTNHVTYATDEESVV